MTSEKSINRAVVTGVLRSATLRETSNGNKVCTFTVMVMQPARNGQQKREFIDCVSWQGQAERVAALPAGGKLYVSGRLQSRSWIGKDGVKHFKVEVISETVESIPTLQSRPDSAITAKRPIDNEDIPF